MSTAMCLNSRLRDPFGPVTDTIRDLTDIVTGNKMFKLEKWLFENSFSIENIISSYVETLTVGRDIDVLSSEDLSHLSTTQNE